jgi:hypothetical protein
MSESHGEFEATGSERFNAVNELGDQRPALRGGLAAHAEQRAELLL